MKTPFTIEQFLDIFKNYNQAVFPMQIVFYMVAVFMIYLSIKPTTNSNKIISGLLAFLWFWMGVVYHLFFFTPINMAAYLFGAMFIFQGILFLAYGVFQNILLFRFNFDLYGIMGSILILFALIIYPVLGYLFGHVYPSSPTFGLPCPTTIFTFGLLLFCKNRCPITILLVPFLWSIIGFSAAFNFGIIEDSVLLVAGLITFVMLVIHNRTLSRNSIAK